MATNEYSISQEQLDLLNKQQTQITQAQGFLSLMLTAMLAGHGVVETVQVVGFTVKESGPVILVQEPSDGAK